MGPEPLTELPCDDNAMATKLEVPADERRGQGRHDGEPSCGGHFGPWKDLNCPAPPPSTVPLGLTPATARRLRRLHDIEAAPLARATALLGRFDPRSVAVARLRVSADAVQFGAFLSDLLGLQAGPTYKNGDQAAVLAPGQGVVSPVYGTTTPADFSPVVGVTWGAPSQGTTITLRASTTNPSADQKVFFTATASNLPAGYFRYLCTTGGQVETVAGNKSNYRASPTQSSSTSGWAAGNGTSNAFYAFDSPGGQWGTLASGGGCFTAPYNWPPAPGADAWYVPAVSNEVSVAWPGKKQIR